MNKAPLLSNDPLISVLMITYNHEPYIEDAIKGVLMQEIDFEVEFIIANDNSKDKTSNVIEGLIAENSNSKITIKYFNHKDNLGMMPNFIFGLKQCKGKYVSLCEGDDYWIDPLKLKKQVQFLEQNQDYVICFHDVKILKDGNLIEDYITDKVAETTTIEDLALRNYMHTPSITYRNHLIDEFPKYFSNAPIGDYFLTLLLARYGKIEYLDEVMSVYRVHGSSYWSSKTQAEVDRRTVSFLKKIQPNFDKKIKDIFIQQYYRKCLRIFKANKYRNIIYLFKCIRIKPYQAIKSGVRVYLHDLK